MDLSWLASVDRDAVRTFAAGDAVAVLTFVVAGELQHGVPVLAEPGRVAFVALPFLLGWAVAAPALGAYSRRVADPQWAVGTALLAWPLADAIGMTLRATAWFPGDAAPALFLVAAAVGGSLLVVWRLIRTAVARFRAP